jgi:hypothetical protein
MLRWRVSHHVFFLLIQGLVLVHRRLEISLMKGDMIGARRAIALSVRMLNSSGVAMRFAGDITSDCYLVVRESMMPPHVPDTFSGLWSIDHRAMIDGLRSLQRCIVNIKTMSDSELLPWQDAFNAAYNAHACVCEHFVGSSPSILMSIKDSIGTRSALEHLEGFRKRTISLVTFDKCKH